MQIEKFIACLGADFYTGVPDSQLKPLCHYLTKEFGQDKRHHVIAANEGNATAIAAGYYLSTGKIPVVYMQNSGIGNAINPIASLLNEKVYGIPMIFIVGWRGQPGVKDEPQHIFQGEVTLSLLKNMDVDTYVVTKDTTEGDVRECMKRFSTQLSQGKQVAFVIAKEALHFEGEVNYKNAYTFRRESALEEILAVTGEDCIVSTTGKTSREIFELRKKNHQEHSHDFLTVGSMGHCSSIALGVAMQNPERRIWCVDGDGAVLMHMGAMATIGQSGVQNFVHIIINNGAHESVGGMPTCGHGINLVSIAKACGYANAVCVETSEELRKTLEVVKMTGQLSLIEVRCAIGSRKDLGRPTQTPQEAKEKFMSNIGDNTGDSRE